MELNSSPDSAVWWLCVLGQITLFGLFASLYTKGLGLMILLGQRLVPREAALDMHSATGSPRFPSHLPSTCQSCQPLGSSCLRCLGARWL